jgi:hypothetical protein
MLKIKITHFSQIPLKHLTDFVSVPYQRKKKKKKKLQ